MTVPMAACTAVVGSLTARHCSPHTCHISHSQCCTSLRKSGHWPPLVHCLTFSQAPTPSRTPARGIHAAVLSSLPASRTCTTTQRAIAGASHAQTAAVGPLTAVVAPPMAHRALQTGQCLPRLSASSATHTSCAHSSRSHLSLRLKSAQAASQRRSASTAQLGSAGRLRSWSCAAATRRAAVTVLASSDAPGSGDGGSEKAAPSATLVIPAAAAGLAVLTTAALTLWREPLEDLLYGDGLGGAADWGAGDIAGGLLWALALYYCSPLQLLLVFLGKFDTERPSDAVLRLIGKAAGLRVDDVDYLRPAWVQGAAVATFIVAGGAMSWAFSAALGDATWAVSSGIGACMAAGLFEVGRPRRLSRDEAVVLEAQWQDFARFAGVRLQRTGRCHESEVFGAFRREYARYRNPETVPDTVLRDMVRNWNPDVDRTRTGYLKGVSLLPRIDAFTGEVTGYQAAVGARATASTIGNDADVSQQEPGS